VQYLFVISLNTLSAFSTSPARLYASTRAVYDLAEGLGGQAPAPATAYREPPQLSNIHRWLTDGMGKGEAVLEQIERGLRGGSGPRQH